MSVFVSSQHPVRISVRQSVRTQKDKTNINLGGPRRQIPLSMTLMTLWVIAGAKAITIEYEPTFGP